MPFLDLEDNNKQEIKEVKDKATIKKTIYYLVKQERQPTEYNQQIPEEDMDNALGAIRQYKRNIKKA